MYTFSHASQQCSQTYIAFALQNGTFQEMFDNGLVLKNFGQSTDELLEPRLQWASGQLPQQRHHLILVCPFAIEVLTKVLLHYSTGDQVGKYQDRVYAANDVVIVLDDDIVRYTSLQTQYPLVLFLHY